MHADTVDTALITHQVGETGKTSWTFDVRRCRECIAEQMMQCARQYKTKTVQTNICKTSKNTQYQMLRF